MKDEKSAAKFHYVKTASGNVVAQSIAFQVASLYWQGVAPFPWCLNENGPTPIGSTCVAHTSLHSAAVVTSLARVWLTGWPVAWNWRRAVLPADAGLLVAITFSLLHHITSHGENGSRPQGPLCPSNITKMTDVIHIYYNVIILRFPMSWRSVHYNHITLLGLTRTYLDGF